MLSATIPSRSQQCPAARAQEKHLRICNAGEHKGLTAAVRRRNQIPRGEPCAARDPLTCQVPHAEEGPSLRRSDFCQSLLHGVTNLSEPRGSLSRGPSTLLIGLAPGISSGSGAMMTLRSGHLQEQAPGNGGPAGRDALTSRRRAPPGTAATEGDRGRAAPDFRGFRPPLHEGKLADQDILEVRFH